MDGILLGCAEHNRAPSAARHCLRQYNITEGLLQNQANIIAGKYQIPSNP